MMAESASWKCQGLRLVEVMEGCPLGRKSSPTESRRSTSAVLHTTRLKCQGPMRCAARKDGTKM